MNRALGTLRPERPHDASLEPPLEAFGTGRRLAPEALGTALLFAVVVVGSGIMGERLAAGNDAIALLGNTLATGAALVVSSRAARSRGRGRACASTISS